jgi:hypothetical protein
MSQIITLSNQQIEEFKKNSVEATPLRKTISLKDLEVVQDNIVKIQGRHITMSESALKDLLKLMNIPVKFDKDFKSSFGDKARAQLINRMRGALAARGNAQITLLLSTVDKRIVGFSKPGAAILSNEGFLDIATQTIDKYGLDVNFVSVNSNGNLVINTSASKNEFGLAGLSDEVFFGGVSFVNDFRNGFSVSPFQKRLVCQNGMSTTAFEESLKMKDFSAEGMSKFYEHLNLLASQGFKPTSFEEKVRKAIATPASLAEMDFASDIIRATTGADLKEVQKWVPTMDTRRAYMDANIEVHLFSKEQTATAKTGMSVWDIANALSDFASHDYGFKMEDKDRTRMQMESGRLLTKKTYDIENLVPSPF